MKQRVLFLDIETAPILAYVWKLWENNVALNQIKQDWYIMSWAAKWEGEKEVFYFDQRNAKNMENDSVIMKKLWKLLDEADIVVGHNLDKFDIKKISARFVMNGLPPPSSFRTVDTLKVAKKMGFTSNKLEYLTDKLCKKYKKQKSRKFDGFSLWTECLNKNMKAWKEMEEYNKLDVLSLEELYSVLNPWNKMTRINYQVEKIKKGGKEIVTYCDCGSDNIRPYGFVYTNAGKYQRHVCKDCGKTFRAKENLLSKDEKDKYLK